MLPPECRPGRRYRLCSQGASVGFGSVLLRSAVADVGVDDDRAGTALLVDRLTDGPIEVIEVVDAPDGGRNVPSVRPEPSGDVVGGLGVGCAFERDAIGVIEHGQLAETEASSDRGSLAADPFHHVAVPGDHPGAVIDDGVAGAVVTGSQHALSHREPDAVGDALTERTGPDVDAGSHAELGMAGSDRVERAERPEVTDADLISGEMKGCVEKSGCVPYREHQSVTVEPRRIPGVVAHPARVEAVGERGECHRCAGVARLGTFDGIGGEETNGVYGVTLPLAERVCSGRLGEDGEPGRGGG